jgi:hypothetical protein
VATDPARRLRTRRFDSSASLGMTRKSWKAGSRTLQGQFRVIRRSQLPTFGVGPAVFEPTRPAQLLTDISETLIRATIMKKLRLAGRGGDMTDRDDMPIIVMSLVSLAVLVIFAVT